MTAFKAGTKPGLPVITLLQYRSYTLTGFVSIVLPKTE